MEKHKSKSTENRLSTHEAICAERYEGITNLLKEMKFEQQSQRDEMSELRQSVSFILGACKALLGISSIIAIILGIMEIANN